MHFPETISNEFEESEITQLFTKNETPSMTEKEKKIMN